MLSIAATNARGASESIGARKTRADSLLHTGHRDRGAAVPIGRLTLKTPSWTHRYWYVTIRSCPPTRLIVLVREGNSANGANRPARREVPAPTAEHTHEDRGGLARWARGRRGVVWTPRRLSCMAARSRGSTPCRRVFASNRPTENPNAVAAECNSGRSGGVEPLRQRRNGRDAVVAYAPTRKPRAVAPAIYLPNGGVDRVRPAQRSRDARAEPEPETEAAEDKLHTVPFVVDTEPRGPAGLPEPMASGLAGDHRGDAAGSTPIRLLCST